MKKIILGMAVLVALSLSAFATAEPINGAVIKQFKQTYPLANNVQWYQGKDYYQVRFNQDEMKTIIYFNNNDQIYRTIRYYGEGQLPPFITLKIKDRYKNKEIINVTELTDTNEGLSYEISLEDAATITIVRSDASGNLKTFKKMNKTM